VSGFGNTLGVVRGQAPVKAVSATDANPAAAPEEPAEKSWWESVSPWVHGALDVAGFVPGLGAIPDLANAAIYGLEGNTEEALWSLGAAVPGVGDAAKGGRLAVKAGKEVAERAAKEAAEKAAKETAEKAAEKASKEAAEKASKEAAQKAEKEAAQKAEKEAAKKAEKEAADKSKKKRSRKAPRKDGGKVKKGPCDHLKKGGKGPHRGGAYGQTRGNKKDNTESHEVPAGSLFNDKDRRDLPAVQMDKNDHKETNTWGSSLHSKAWRENYYRLLQEGKWREVMRQGVLDLRDIGRQHGKNNRMNERALQMLKYYKCLEAHGLLPKLKDSEPVS
jgi:hypothetical protein